MNLSLLSKPLTYPWATSALPTLLRIALGVLLVYHGSPKIFNGTEGIVTSLTAMEWPMPAFLAYMAGLIEFVGGICIVVGLLTRPMALASIVLFCAIYFGYHAADPFPKKEKALLFLILSVFTFMSGPGKASVDALLFREKTTS